MKRVCLLALLGLGALDVACASDFSFGPPERLTLVRNAAGNVAIGDANGDGRADLASTSGLSGALHELSLFVQRADGSLSSPVKLPLPEATAYIYPVTFADLDRDGTDEILVGGPGMSWSVVRLDGGQLSVANHPGRGCAYFVTGEVNADGNVDVLCHDWKETLMVYLGDGRGGFVSRLEVRTPAGTYNQDFKRLRLADFTGDGRPDLLLTASTVNSFFVLPNNGMGGFWPATVYTHPKSAALVWSSALEVLDVDGDGITEVVTASPDNRPASALNVYRRGANGYLALSKRIRIYDSITALLTGDVDRDGDPDLLAGHFGFNAVTLVGGGTVGLASQTRYDLPGFLGHSNAMAMGDLNGDGCNDLASATYSGVLLLHGCRPLKTRVPASDFDGDGVADLLWHDGENRLWHWGELRAWQEEIYPHVPSMSRDWSPQGTGDFNGDGSSDVFWRNRTTGANEIRHSAYYRLAIAGVSSQDWQVAGVGDFDGDDGSDLLWRNSRTGANVIWKSGNAATKQTTAGVADQRWKVAGTGDFDGDGRSDILWRHSASGRNAIWRSGRRDIPQAMTIVESLQWTVAGTGDFDGDGKDDVVWRNTSTGENAIWRSANSAMRMPITHVSELDWTIAAVADYNGDGRSDLMWHNTNTGDNVIWRSASSQQRQDVATTSLRFMVVR